MFKDAEQAKTFTNLLERFNLSVIRHVMLKGQGFEEAAKDMAVQVNKDRDTFEAFLLVASGISSFTDTTDTMLCPDCGGVMALRTNKSNGNKFWGCKKFPECRGTRDENGLSKQEREEQRYKREAPQEAGFSFNKAKRNPVTEVSPPSDVVNDISRNFNPFRK